MLLLAIWVGVISALLICIIVYTLFWISMLTDDVHRLRRRIYALETHTPLADTP